jgi:predicted ATPase/DNA-binding CsgD family transcriptional regulator
MNSKGQSPLIEPLTDREADVLALLVEGKTNREIAEVLVLSINTVKWYNRQIYGKLGVKNREGVAERARALGLVGIDESARPQRQIYNLPHPATPLLGRERELEELESLLLDGRTRIVSIIGPGGMGKTRLAIELAQRLNGRFVDGAAFVPLAPLQSEESIVPAIAQSLRFTFQGGSQDEKTQLLNFLRRKELLLVLDNYEHLIKSASLLIEIAEAAPNLKMVVTSREKLKLRIEQLYPLQSLSLISWETVAQAEQDPAVRLFLEYGLRVRPNFELQTEDLDALHQILQLVDGMPLAIILASAWLELLTPVEIGAEIEKNIDFLEADYQDLPGRQRSMRAVFDAAWNQLNEAEQKVFSSLSVFQGGFTLDAARMVVGATPGILLGLVSRSLLNRDENGRFEIHELLRQFAADKLNMLIDWKTAVRSYHSAYYCTLLQHHTVNWYNARQIEALAEVTLEDDNIQRAWHWALLQGEFGQLANSIHSWARFHEWRGRLEEGKRICVTIIEKAESKSKESTIFPDCLRLWAKALIWLSRFTYDDRIALLKLEQSMALLERLKSAGYDVLQEKAFLLLRRSTSLLTLNLLEARQSAEQSLHLYRKLGNQWGIAQSLHNLNHIDFRTGALDLNTDKGQAVLDIYNKMGDLRSQISHMAQQGIFLKVLGQFERAEQMERDVLSRSKELDNRTKVSQANLTYTLLWRGKFAEAYQMAKESLEICRNLGHRHTEVWTQYSLSQILMHKGHYKSSRQSLADGLIVAEAIGDRDNEAALYGTLGQLGIIASDHNEAQAAFTKSAEIFRESPHSLTDFSKAGLGYMAIYLNQLEKARRYLIEGIVTALSIKNYQQNLFALTGVALLLVKMGDNIRALEIWTLAKTQPMVARSIWFEEVVGRVIDKEIANLPSETAAAAQERGRGLDLWETAESFLQELATP